MDQWQAPGTSPRSHPVSDLHSEVVSCEVFAVPHITIRRILKEEMRVRPFATRKASVVCATASDHDVEFVPKRFTLRDNRLPTLLNSNLISFLVGHTNVVSDVEDNFVWKNRPVSIVRVCCPLPRSFVRAHHAQQVSVAAKINADALTVIEFGLQELDPLCASISRWRKKVHIKLRSIATRSV